MPDKNPNAPIPEQERLGFIPLEVPPIEVPTPTVPGLPPNLGPYIMPKDWPQNVPAPYPPYKPTIELDRPIKDWVKNEHMRQGKKAIDDGEGNEHGCYSFYWDKTKDLKQPQEAAIIQNLTGTPYDFVVVHHGESAEFDGRRPGSREVLELKDHRDGQLGVEELRTNSNKWGRFNDQIARQVRVAKACGFEPVLVTPSHELAQMLQERWQGRADRPEVRQIEVPDYIRELGPLVEEETQEQPVAERLQNPKVEFKESKGLSFPPLPEVPQKAWKTLFTQMEANNKELNVAIANLSKAIDNSIPDRADAYPKTWSQERVGSAHVLTQHFLSEQEQTAIVLASTKKWIDRSGQQDSSGQTVVFSNDYAATRDGQTTTLYGKDTYLPLMSYDRNTQILTLERPLDATDSALVEWAQQQLLAEQQKQAQIAVQPQQEIGGYGDG